MGDFPDEFGEFGMDEPEHEPLARGWLPPEDRLWRHPSEMGGDLSPLRSPSGRSGVRWGALAAGALSVAAVTTVAMVVTGGGPRTVHATDTSVVIGPDVVKVVDSVARSLVSLVPPKGAAHDGRATGVVLPGGELVVTAAAAVVDGEHLTVVSEDDHRLSGVVAGVDAISGVAVVRVSDKLASGSFVDEPVVPEQFAVAACRCAGGNALHSSPDVALGMIRTQGTSPGYDGGPSLIDAIEAEMPLGTSALGTVLLDNSGRVLGILDGERTVSGETVGYFVPTSLAVGVADELATTPALTHGWLGVICQDDNGAGAMVMSVLAGSPAAAAGLEPGDVLAAVDAHQVSSLADLQARLYVSQPGAVMDLTVLRAGSVNTMPVTVAAKPS